MSRVVSEDSELVGGMEIRGSPEGSEVIDVRLVGRDRGTVVTSLTG